MPSRLASLLALLVLVGCAANAEPAKRPVTVSPSGPGHGWKARPMPYPNKAGPNGELKA